MDAAMINAIKFFRDHAGFCTPPGRLASAKTLAEAERTARDRGWSVIWDAEDLDPEDSFEREEDVEAIRSGRYLWLYAYVVGANGTRGASLGAITLTDWSDPYKRVVEAELYATQINEHTAEPAETLATKIKRIVERYRDDDCEWSADTVDEILSEIESALIEAEEDKL